MFSIETSIPIEWAGAAMRWCAFQLRLHRIPVIERVLFWTFAGRLRALFHTLEENDCSPDGYTHNHYMAKRDIERVLTKFRIPHPNISADTVTIWCHFLPLLIQECEDGNLKRARKIMGDPALRFATVPPVHECNAAPAGAPGAGPVSNPAVGPPGVGGDFSSFDLPLHRAVDHVVQTSQHSYNSSSGAERMALQALHEAMCQGRLEVVGSWGEGSPPQLIDQQECQQMQLVAVCVPANPTVPNGIRFDLVDKATLENPPLHEIHGPSSLTALRVRSNDFYGLWPPLKEENDD